MLYIKQVLSWMPCFVYILALQKGKYYVGITENYQYRMRRHFNGGGTRWTIKFKPIRVEQKIPVQSKFDEDKWVKIYMSKYGVRNVRGGAYSSIRMSSAVQNALVKQIRNAQGRCFQCGSKTHFASYCPNKRARRSYPQGNRRRLLLEKKEEKVQKMQRSQNERMIAIKIDDSESEDDQLLLKMKMLDQTALKRQAKQNVEMKDEPNQQHMDPIRLQADNVVIDEKIAQQIIQQQQEQSVQGEQVDLNVRQGQQVVLQGQDDYSWMQQQQQEDLQEDQQDDTQMLNILLRSNSMRQNIIKDNNENTKGVSLWDSQDEQIDQLFLQMQLIKHQNANKPN